MLKVCNNHIPKNNYLVFEFISIVDSSALFRKKGKIIGF
jgi:hypothetical protein